MKVLKQFAAGGVPVTFASSPSAGSTAPPRADRLRCAEPRTHLLFVRVHQLPVVPGLQLPWGLSSGQRGVEDEQLPGTVCRLQRTERIWGVERLRDPESKLK